MTLDSATSVVTGRYGKRRRSIKWQRTVSDPWIASCRPTCAALHGQPCSRGENFWQEFDLYSQYNDTLATNLGISFMRGTGQSFGMDKFEEAAYFGHGFYTVGNLTYSGGFAYIKTFEGIYEGVDYNLEALWRIGNDKTAALNFIYNDNILSGEQSWLLEAEATKTLPIRDKLNLNLIAKVDYSSEFIGVKGWNQAQIKAKFPYQLTPTTILEPYIAQSFALDGLRDFGEENHAP